MIKSKVKNKTGKDDEIKKKEINFKAQKKSAKSIKANEEKRYD